MKRLFALALLVLGFGVPVLTDAASPTEVLHLVHDGKPKDLTAKLYADGHRQVTVHVTGETEGRDLAHFKAKLHGVMHIKQGHEEMKVHMTVRAYRHDVYTRIETITGHISGFHKADMWRQKQWQWHHSHLTQGQLDHLVHTLLLGDSHGWLQGEHTRYSGGKSHKFHGVMNDHHVSAKVDLNAEGQFRFARVYESKHGGKHAKELSATRKFTPVYLEAPHGAHHSDHCLCSVLWHLPSEDMWPETHSEPVDTHDTWDMDSHDDWEDMWEDDDEWSDDDNTTWWPMADDGDAGWSNVWDNEEWESETEWRQHSDTWNQADAQWMVSDRDEDEVAPPAPLQASLIGRAGSLERNQSIRQQRNNQRRHHLEQILDAIEAYVHQHGRVPSDIPTQQLLEICPSWDYCKEGINLEVLAPYIDVIPEDPQLTDRTGYLLRQDPHGLVTAQALFPELNETIILARRMKTTNETNLHYLDYGTPGYNDRSLRLQERARIQQALHGGLTQNFKTSLSQQYFGIYGAYGRPNRRAVEELVKQRRQERRLWYGQ